jgi:hypothetical protein
MEDEADKVLSPKGMESMTSVFLCFLLAIDQKLDIIVCMSNFTLESDFVCVSYSEGTCKASCAILIRHFSYSAF